MKYLIAPLLWALAVVLTAAIVYRMWRGHNVVLRGRWSPRIVRLVVILLVLLGIGVEKPRAGAAPLTDDKTKTKGDELPPSVSAEAITRWLTVQQPAGAWRLFKRQFLQLTHATSKPDAATVPALKTKTRSLPPKFQALVNADLDAL